MTQGKIGKAKNPVEQLGFVLNCEAKPCNCLEYLLVQLDKIPHKYIVFEVKKSPFRRCYHYLLVMSILAHRRLKWENHKRSERHEKEPIDFPLRANVVAQNTKGERFLYQFMVRFYYDALKQDKTRTPRLPPQLRDNIKSIFKAKMCTAAELGTEKGEAVELLVKENEVEKKFRFWRKDDFPFDIFSDTAFAEIDIPPEGPPVTTFKEKELGDLLDTIINSDFWKRWERQATKKRASIKSKDNIEDVLRNHLIIESHAFRSERLHARIGDYQSLEMKVGVVEQVRDLKGNDESSVFNKQEYAQNRIWKPFNSSLLLNQTGVYILSSDTGTGKTTMLRDLQHKILMNKKYIPIFLHAKTMEKWDYKNTNVFLRYLAEAMQLEVATEKLVGFLKKDFYRKIVLFVDGLDQISGVGAAYKHLLDKLLRICSNNLIVASCPNAVMDYEKNTNVKFLRLKPFNHNVQKTYFGDNYQRGCELCKQDKMMMSVPMLAYMIRTLIEEGRDKGVENRASLYKEFIDYILHSYDHEEADINEDGRTFVRRTLKELSYEALRKRDPMKQDIPLEFCLRFIPKPWRIDDIPRYGLVGLKVDRGKGVHKSLYFTHQSFQEYLAAEWASESEERISYLIDNYWDPRWKETIKFLTGIVGESLIRRLYPGPNHDNAIHSRLFFAAECAGEINISSEFEEELIFDCFILFTVDKSFGFNSIRALLKLGTEEAHDTAWRWINIRESNASFTYAFSEANIIEPLFSKQRFNRVFNDLKRSIDLTPAFDILKQWSWAFSRREITELINMIKVDDRETKIIHMMQIDPRKGVQALLLTPGDAAVNLLGAIKPSKFEHKHVQQTLKKLNDPQTHSWALLALSAMASKFNKKDIAKVIEMLGEKWANEQVCAARIIENINARNLSRSNIREIIEKYWFVSEKASEILAKSNGEFKKIIGPKEVNIMLERLGAEDKAVRIKAFKMLIGIGITLRMDQIQKVLECLDEEKYAYLIIGETASLLGALTRSDIYKILDMISTGDENIRHAAMDSVKYFKTFLRKEDIVAILRNLEDREYHVTALYACQYIVDRLTEKDIWKLLHSFESYVNTIDGMKAYEALGQSLALRLNVEQNRYIIEQAFSNPGYDRSVWIKLASPYCIPDDALNELVKLPKDEHDCVLYDIVSWLQRVHNLGHL